MASLKDIARDFGVSISLVSKVLNDRMGTTGVRGDLQEAIRKRAAELNYRKNRSALALFQQRQDVLGVFLHREGRLGSGLMEELIEGISRGAMPHGHRLMLAFFQDAAEFKGLAQLAHRGVMDGLLVGGITHPELAPALLDIERAGLPVVTIMQQPLHARLPNVAVDQVEVGRLGTRHLLDAGCRHIAHIRDFPDRFTGYQKALKEAGLAYSERLVFGGTSDFGHAKGEAAARHFLQQNIQMDGRFAQSDEEAIGAMNVFCEAGRKVPGDLRIVGVDNAPYAEFSRTPLTSVSQSARERGLGAVQLLFATQTGQPPASIRVAPQLVIRASSQP